MKMILYLVTKIGTGTKESQKLAGFESTTSHERQKNLWPRFTLLRPVSLQSKTCEGYFPQFSLGHFHSWINNRT